MPIQPNVPAAIHIASLRTVIQIERKARAQDNARAAALLTKAQQVLSRSR